jgi:hypothetical protein
VALLKKSSGSGRLGLRPFPTPSIFHRDQPPNFAQVSSKIPWRFEASECSCPINQSTPYITDPATLYLCLGGRTRLLKRDFPGRLARDPAGNRRHFYAQRRSRKGRKKAVPMSIAAGVTLCNLQS